MKSTEMQYMVSRLKEVSGALDVDIKGDKLSVPYPGDLGGVRGIYNTDVYTDRQLDLMCDRDFYKNICQNLAWSLNPIQQFIAYARHCMRLGWLLNHLSCILAGGFVILQNPEFTGHDGEFYGTVADWYDAEDNILMFLDSFGPMSVIALTGVGQSYTYEGLQKL